MHFRVRKNVIQLIRVNYDADKKRGVNTVLGSIRLNNPELSPELHALLTQEEVAEFDAWLKSHFRAIAIREELAALSLAEEMTHAQKWFEREGNTEAARAAAANIVSHWQQLRRIMGRYKLLD